MLLLQVINRFVATVLGACFVLIATGSPVDKLQTGSVALELGAPAIPTTVKKHGSTSRGTRSELLRREGEAEERVPRLKELGLLRVHAAHHPSPPPAHHHPPAPPPAHHAPAPPPAHHAHHHSHHAHHTSTRRRKDANATSPNANATSGLLKECKMVKVFSAGHDSGDKAEFWLGDEHIQQPNSSKGLNIVTIDIDKQEVIAKKNYDIRKDPDKVNKQIIADIVDLKKGTAVLIGIMDTGLEDLSPETIAIFQEDLGAKIEKGQFDEGWALVGIKLGGPALAELQGPSAETGLVELPCNMYPPEGPTTTTTEIPTTGDDDDDDVDDAPDDAMATPVEPGDN